MARILVAEDTPENLEFVKLVLEQAGHEVVSAQNGAEAVAQARASHPHLILMDMQMPVMDGLSATRLLKGDTALAAIKVIALTALAMQGDFERMSAAGCDGYLAKPFSYKELLRVVAEAVAGLVEEDPPDKGLSEEGGRP
jgi:two-component system cell cycle response regulator DivK